MNEESRKMNKPPFQNFSSWRPYQSETISQIQNKFTIISAPTGSGKSLIGMTLCKEHDRSLYLCSTKTLQDQLSTDFPGIPILKGRSNYPCIYNDITESSFPEITCEDCVFEVDDNGERDSCSGCTYKIHKAKAFNSSVAILNMSYFVTETNYVGMFSGRDIVIVDECDKLESEILRFVSLSVSDRQMEQFSLEPPKFKTKVESWKDWANKYLPYIRDKVKTLLSQFQKRNNDISLLRQFKSADSLHKKMKMFIESVDSTWIYKDSGKKWEFKPIWISQFMEKYFWAHAKKFVLMSATPPLKELLGLTECDEIEIPSQFPKENRRVIYNPVANLTHKTMAQEMGKLLGGVIEIVNKYPNDKGLIHTVSYTLASYLSNNINSNRVMTHDGSSRTETLEKFKLSKKPLILISPSMDRGVDLLYDAARWCIVAKVPFLDLSDKQVSSRLHSGSFGRRWYASQAANTIMQMTGRIVRAMDDYGTSWILDKQFETFYGRNSKLFHNWWTEALEYH